MILTLSSASNLSKNNLFSKEKHPINGKTLFCNMWNMPWCWKQYRWLLVIHPIYMQQIYHKLLSKQTLIFGYILTWSVYSIRLEHAFLLPLSCVTFLLQSNAVMTRSNITRHYIHHLSDWSRVYISVLTTKVTPYLALWAVSCDDFGES